MRESDLKALQLRWNEVPAKKSDFSPPENGTNFSDRLEHSFREHALSKILETHDSGNSQVVLILQVKK